MSQVLEKQGQDKPQSTSQQETIKTIMVINKMKSKQRCIESIKEKVGCFKI